MANYLPSNLAVGQASLTQSFQAGEMRYRDPVVWKNLLAGQALATPDYQSLRTRDDRAYDVDYMVRTSRALGSTYSHTHSYGKSDTQKFTPSYATVSDGFYTSLKQADRNRRSLQEMYNHELMNAVLNFTEGLETASSDFLFANRSQVNGVTAEGTFNATNDVFEITEATEGNRAMQITNSTMDLLKYQGFALDVYCDTISYNKFKYQFAQGGGNSENLNFQFTEGNVTYFHVAGFNGDAAALLYTKGYWQVVPKGMAVALDWIPKQNREGVASTSIGGVAEYSSIINPIDGAEYGIHKIWAGADETANNGMVQDVKEDVQIFLQYSLNLAPLTTATEYTNIAFALV